MSPEQNEPLALEMAHVLFMDIVGYSQLMIDHQRQYLQQLQDIVRGIKEFQRAQARDQLISLPTGDGMALVFFGDLVAPVRCALEVSRALQNHLEIELRMGLHTGPVYRIADINMNQNVAGGGINIAQRVMDCGDAGHILLSKAIADELAQTSEWKARLVDLGETEVKHGVKVHIFSLHTADCGKQELPKKLQAKYPHNTIIKPTISSSEFPSIWNMPNRNPNFTGREVLLSDLHERLVSKQHAVVTQAISGLGGVGKTQLAIEYAYRYCYEYKVVWWMRSEESTTLASDLSRLAWKLALPEKDVADQTVIVEAVRNWLRRNSAWLLIFDNAPDISAIRNYLPQGGKGHVLITSRDQNWRGVANPLPISVMLREEAVDFLLKRTYQTDNKAAVALSEALGELPLALEQAGAFIEATSRSISDYLTLFHKHKSELLHRGKPSTDYPATVATTWEISFQQVQNICPPAADLMNLCSFLAPDEIPRELFFKGGQHLHEQLITITENVLIFDDAVEALRRYSLISANSSALSVHRLVQAVVQDRLSYEHKRAIAETALKLVNETFPAESDDVRTWPTCKNLLSHALVVTEHAEELKLTASEAGRLLNQVGLYLRGRAEFKEANLVLERALILDQAAHGIASPTVAIRLNNIGDLLEAQGDISGAREKYEQALTINEDFYGRNHPTVASNINNLGNILKRSADLIRTFTQDDQSLVRELVEGVSKVWRIWKVDDENYFSLSTIHTSLPTQLYGPLAPKVFYSAVEDVMHYQNSPAFKAVMYLMQAQCLFERALRINLSGYGANHPTVASNLNNLGNVFLALCDLPSARQHFERALVINETFYGSNHPTVASIVNSLGSVWKRLGYLEEALEQFKRALSIDEAAYGAKHFLVALRINNIGRVLQESGDLEGAHSHYTRALDILSESLGEGHPYTCVVRINLDSIK